MELRHLCMLVSSFPYWEHTGYLYIGGCLRIRRLWSRSARSHPSPLCVRSGRSALLLFLCQSGTSISWTGSAYHKALRSRSPESSLSLKVLSVDFVTSHRASFVLDRFVRVLIWSTASVIFAKAVDGVAVRCWLCGVFPRRPSVDCAMV